MCTRKEGTLRPCGEVSIIQSDFSGNEGFRENYRCCRSSKKNRENGNRNECRSTCAFAELPQSVLALQQGFADRAVVTATVMVGFRGNIERREHQNNKHQQSDDARCSTLSAVVRNLSHCRNCLRPFLGNRDYSTFFIVRKEKTWMHLPWEVQKRCRTAKGNTAAILCVAPIRVLFGQAPGQRLQSRDSRRFAASAVSAGLPNMEKRK